MLKCFLPKKSESKLQKDNAIYRRINYLYATETSSSRSVSCIFGVVIITIIIIIIIVINVIYNNV